MPCGEACLSWGSTGWARPPDHAIRVRTSESRTDRCFGEPPRDTRRHNTHSVHPAALEDSLLAAASPPVTSLQRIAIPLGRRLAPEPEAESRAPAERFDPDGVYVRRDIPELGTPDYPSPMAMAA
jgi:hypothetical protein